MADTTFARHYQTELAYYRELAQEFARAYPEVAHIVSERGGDPSAERLFQGAALLTSRLRHHVEDDLPEVIHTLFAQLWPQYLRPVPAITLVRFDPIANALQQSQVVPRHTTLLSQAIGHKRSGAVECDFQTSAAVDLNPVALEAIELNQARPSDLELRLNFRMSGGATFDNAGIRAISLHFLGDEVTRHTLYLWLARCAHQISLRSAEGEHSLTLPRDVIRPVGLSEEESLCPSMPIPLGGLRLFEEFLIFPDKFLGVRVEGLDRVPAGDLNEAFQLVFHLGQPPDPNLKVKLENVAINCTPAVNLSEVVQVEIPVEPDRHLFRVVAPQGWPVFEIERVGSYHHRTGDWLEFRPLHGGALQREGSDRLPWYGVLRRTDSVEGTQTYLVCTDASGRPAAPPAEVVQIWLKHTHGDLPLLLKPGQVDLPTSSSPEFVTFMNVSPVVSGRALKLVHDHHWRLLAEFNMHPDDLFSLAGLQQLMEAARCGTTGLVMPQIRSVTSRLSSRLHQQTMVPVRQILVEVEEEAYTCEGQAYLFATILNSLFASPPTELVFHQLTVRIASTGVDYSFPPH
jgi:type VI secretion system protein ImpG